MGEGGGRLWQVATCVYEACVLRVGVCFGARLGAVVMGVCKNEAACVCGEMWCVRRSEKAYFSRPHLIMEGRADGNLGRKQTSFLSRFLMRMYGIMPVSFVRRSIFFSECTQ